MGQRVSPLPQYPQATWPVPNAWFVQRTKAIVLPSPEKFKQDLLHRTKRGGQARAIYLNPLKIIRFF